MLDRNDLKRVRLKLTMIGAYEVLCVEMRGMYTRMCATS
jgi:hypothetical protein